MILFFVSTSCVDLVEDTSSIIILEDLKSEADITASLSPMYRLLANANQVAHQRICTYGADDITTWIGGNKAPFRVYDKFDFGSGENSDSDWLYDHSWEKYWKLIYYANTLIDGLKTSTAPEEVKLKGEGEARMFRGWAYFQLVRRFGGMPIIIDGVIPTGDETRATVLDTYKIIEEDFKKASEYLPHPASTEPGRFSSAAASSYLASLYLTYSNYFIEPYGLLLHSYVYSSFPIDHHLLRLHPNK